MRQISSRMTVFYKRVFPVILFGLLILFMVIPWITEQRSGPPIGFSLISIVTFIIVYFFMRKLVFDLVDEVLDAGDALVVKNGDRQDRIALSNIMNVSYSPLINPPRVTLFLRTPSLFGNKVTFCAPVRFMPFTSSPIVDGLIERVDATRRPG